MSICTKRNSCVDVSGQLKMPNTRRSSYGSLRVEPFTPPLDPGGNNSREAKLSGPFMKPRLCMLLSFS